MKKPCCGRETARFGQKFDTYRNLQRHRAVHPAIARLLYNKCACLLPLVWFQAALDWIIGHFLPRYATWLCHSMSSVCPSVTFRYRDHIGWNTSKITSLLISLRFMLGWPPKWAIWSNGNIPKIRVEQDYRSGVMSKKPAVSQKRCKILPRLLWGTNRKLHTCFRIRPKSMTLDDLEWPKHSCGKLVLRSSPEKFE